MIRGPSFVRGKSIPLPLEEGSEEIAPIKNPSQKVITVRDVTLPANSQCWVKVRTSQHGLVHIQPVQKLYSSKMCLTGNGIAQVQPGKEFGIFIANFGDTPVQLKTGHKVGTAQPHPKWIREATSTTHGEILGIINESKENSYKKRQIDAKDVTIINDYLAKLRESQQEKSEKIIRVEDISLEDVPKRHHEAIRSMLKNHEKIWLGELGEISVTEHSIDLKTGSRPFKSAPYRTAPKARELEETELKKQLDAGIIERAQSEWAAPVLFVPKKDGKLRFCVDYRKLNEMTVKDSYPLPRMEDCIDSLGDAVIFSTLDANSGYWQMKIRKEDRSKTAFVTHSGVFQYLRKPFGLTNAPASFQRALDQILQKYKWKTCLIYLDDIIIYSNSIEEHIRHVDEILTALGEASVTLNIEKCKFFTKTVEYLGHIIKPGTLEVDSANTQSLRQAGPPTTRTGLKSFLGLCNVYRKFIRNFSKTAGPLNELLKKNSPDKFELNEKQIEAFRTLIDQVLSPTVLALPRKDLPFSLDTDASNYGIGCALFQ